jgi:hypothetical protein
MAIIPPGLSRTVRSSASRRRLRGRRVPAPAPVSQIVTRIDRLNALGVRLARALHESTHTAVRKSPRTTQALTKQRTAPRTRHRSRRYSGRGAATGGGYICRTTTLGIAVSMRMRKGPPSAICAAIHSALVPRRGSARAAVLPALPSGRLPGWKAPVHFAIESADVKCGIPHLR